MIHVTEEDYMFIKMKTTEKCFYCRQHIEAPFISWQGHVFIKLHKRCAELLSQRLLSDALDLEHAVRKISDGIQ